MKKIESYYMVCESSLAKFQKEVNDHLKAGYELHGNAIVVSVPDGPTTLYQALIKYSYTDNTTNI